MISWLSVRAEADEVAPLPPKMEPQAAEEIAGQFHDALAKGLRAGGLKVTAPAKVRARVSAGCDEGACVREAEGSLKAHRVATAKVSSVGKNYTIEVRLYSGNQLQTRSTGRCDICTLAEALQTTVKAATEVGSRGEEPPMETMPVLPAPKVQPQPKPRVELLPKKPAKARMQPAPEPPRVAERPIEPPVAQPPPKVPLETAIAPIASPREPWPMWPAIVTGAVGVVGLGAGIALLAMNGKYTDCRGDPRADFRNCANIYDTGKAGGALAAMGGASLVASGVLFYLHFASKPSERSSAGVERFTVAPLVEGGAVVGAAGRF
jgi:hypothetical protein